ncbi:hypothetical protein N7492_009203 [Penicillium capsulatum]|uniref:Uncharacterized protein n=1 Tax=Penicillium capsulatum TaxID=69766 RepID=A0A9W9LI11_9EURO|nr:hypothetical protein N7492_009203 [Penicillium capsulatum]KAJ6106599.1 hypothetical protein N7512_010116 [Penicillium capsulatum]
MDAPTPSRRPFLKLLYRRLKDCETFFLSPGNLQSLGIQAFQVGSTDDGILQFQPFFSGRIRRESSSTSAMTEGLPKLHYQPDFDSILKGALLAFPNAETALKFARDEYEEEASLSSPDEWETHAYKTNSYINSVNYAERKGRPISSCLTDLGCLQSPR